MAYELQLVEEKVKMHQVTALHLICSFAFIGAGAIIYVYNETVKPWGVVLLVSGFLLMALTLFKNRFVTAPKPNTIFHIAELLLAAPLAVYAGVMRWNVPLGIFGAISAALVFALFWERKGNAIQSIHITESGISLPFESRKRSLQWTEVEKVLLRFGTLSIDCVDNRLFQWNIRDIDFKPADLETYCLKHVEDNREKRIKDDW